MRLSSESFENDKVCVRAVDSSDHKCAVHAVHRRAIHRTLKSRNNGAEVTRFQYHFGQCPITRTFAPLFFESQKAEKTNSSSINPSRCVHASEAARGPFPCTHSFRKQNDERTKTIETIKQMINNDNVSSSLSCLPRTCVAVEWLQRRIL